MTNERLVNITKLIFKTEYELQIKLKEVIQEIEFHKRLIGIEDSNLIIERLKNRIEYFLFDISREIEYSIYLMETIRNKL